MEIKQLEYFVTAHNCGSLSKAAAKLFTTQPNPMSAGSSNFLNKS
ncbi:LysR family transcriptional regulator [Leuconostoc mesenteroides]|nr:LysR family transcriptional regulator [Leuconostoc mesenteroides]